MTISRELSPSLFANATSKPRRGPLDRTLPDWLFASAAPAPGATGATAAKASTVASVGTARSARGRSRADLLTGSPLSSQVSSPLSSPLSSVSSQGSSGSGRSAALEPELPRPGAILDKYRIEEVIGRGGFAVVYRATHLLLESSVAVKFLRPSVLKRHPGLAAALCDEARFAARINHPNVVRVHDVTHTDEITYAVMEFVPGSSLAQVLARQGALPPQEVIRIGIDVAWGLRAGLEQGLIHRDIKPGNILIGGDGRVKIVDLGLALPTLSLPTVAADGASSDGTSRHRGFVGTRGYAAPEQVLSPDSVDFRADVYSLGATLYHAVAGEPPFGKERRPGDPVPSPESRVPGLSAGFATLIRRLLSESPHDRASSYDVLLRELRELQHESPPSRPAPPAARR
jgi:serine/threonine protein kinase